MHRGERDASIGRGGERPERGGHAAAAAAAASISGEALRRTGRERDQTGSTYEFVAPSRDQRVPHLGGRGSGGASSSTAGFADGAAGLQARSRASWRRLEATRVPREARDGCRVLFILGGDLGKARSARKPRRSGGGLSRPSRAGGWG